jgi:uncharacterized protein YndB with AHSA1/START domain
MQQVPSDPTTLVLVGDFERMSPERLFEHLTQPNLLTQWWPSEAVSDPKIGGTFTYTWPSNNWILRGEFLAFEPGRHLSFSWCWDHEPVEHGHQKVDMWIEPYLDGGSLLAIYHGEFDTTEADQAARQGIAEGWIHFTMHLGGLTDGIVD